MSEKCIWLHESLEVLPLISYPFEVDTLPRNGIYFFYEVSEFWGHGENNPRIVRVGTHKGNNFRSRISEHYLLSEKKTDLDKDRPKPSDRSIFRKNIGRALLNQNNDPYLEVWEIDFMSRRERREFGNLRDINKEKHLEREITNVLRNRFSFKVLIIQNEDDRIGEKGLESSLIGTVNKCNQCTPSISWFGKHSPKKKIRDSGLWQVQHLKSQEIDKEGKVIIMRAILKTLEWFKLYGYATSE